MLPKNVIARSSEKNGFFCALLAHLFLQKGNNLATFIELVDAKLPTPARLTVTGLEHAELYLEFAYLRDYWNGLGRDNGAKRDFIFGLLSQVDSLAYHQSADFPKTIPEFNERFMGSHGRAIRDDIVYPGQWSVAALDKQFDQRQQESIKFRDLCRFKWAFNIKPDLVLLIPGSTPLCIEAKLESKEGWYPASDSEAQIFDRRFDPQKGRVRQIELQGFMFEKLLRSPCQQVLICRDKKEYQGKQEYKDVAILCWLEVFDKLDKTGSLPFVEKLISENIYLRSS